MKFLTLSTGSLITNRFLSPFSIHPKSPHSIFSFWFREIGTLKGITTTSWPTEWAQAPEKVGVLLTLFMNSWDPQLGLWGMSKRIISNNSHLIRLTSQVQCDLLSCSVLCLCKVWIVFWKVLYFIEKCLLQNWGSSCFLKPKGIKFIANKKEDICWYSVNWWRWRVGLMLTVRC